MIADLLLICIGCGMLSTYLFLYMKDILLRMPQHRDRTAFAGSCQQSSRVLYVFQEYLTSSAVFCCRSRMMAFSCMAGHGQKFSWQKEHCPFGPNSCGS